MVRCVVAVGLIYTLPLLCVGTLLYTVVLRLVDFLWWGEGEGERERENIAHYFRSSLKAGLEVRYISFLLTEY